MAKKPKKPGPPLSHPRAAGFEAAVAQAVKDELRRQGGSGGGGDDTEILSRLSRLESDMSHANISLGDIKQDIRDIRNMGIGAALAAGAVVFGILLWADGKFASLSTQTDPDRSQVVVRESSFTRQQDSPVVSEEESTELADDMELIEPPESD